MEQLKRQKYRLRNHRTSITKQFRRRRYSQRYHKTLNAGVKKKNNQK
jgi:hypothetical protein